MAQGLRRYCGREPMVTSGGCATCIVRHRVERRRRLTADTRFAVLVKTPGWHSNPHVAAVAKL
jgi:hypothetical protein